MNANARDFNPNAGEYTPPDPNNYPPKDTNYPTQDVNYPYYDPSSGYQEYSPLGDGHEHAYYQPPPPVYPEEATQEWNQAASETVPDGLYSSMSHLTPQLYGAPISALAYDDEYEALYVASHTQKVSSTRRRQFNRASMMVTHSTLDGMLYSSCMAHPEASSHALAAVYRSMYGTNCAATAAQVVPNHAYQPPYGSDPTGYGSTSHIGITTLLPFKGHVASVSPSAVRVHTHGGLCVSDQDVEGMMAAAKHPSGDHHVFCGGVATNTNKSHVHCMDVYQNLRTVYSHSFRSEIMSSGSTFGVLSMATNFDKQTLVVGCSDGTCRILDGKRGGSCELAKLKSHVAGVTNVAVSNDGNLLCTTGFGSRPKQSRSPYAFPDQFCYIYDVRYLGRGGILHPFSVVEGGPRCVEFIPNVENQPKNRVLVASGQAHGGLQIICPFEQNDDTNNFLLPQLGSRECITAMHVSDQYLAISTSESNVFQYEMAGYSPSSTLSYSGAEFIPSSGTRNLPSSNTSTKEKKPLVMPPYVPPLPAVSIDPIVLQSDHARAQSGASLLRSIFNQYKLCGNATITGDVSQASFYKATHQILLPAPKRNLSLRVQQDEIKREGDIMSTIPTSELQLNLLEPPDSKPNPNRLIFDEKLSQICYEAPERRETRKSRRFDNQRNRKTEQKSSVATDVDVIPSRYKRTLSGGAGFHHGQYNETNLWPGWDYSPSMPNAYAPPVLLALYFVPELRSIMLAKQFGNAKAATTKAASAKNDLLLSTELGFLFHQMECLSQYARMYPEVKVGAFVPANFLTTFCTMPEAEALALLDGAPAAVEKARRPEAFFRFLLHHLNKELSNNKTKDKLIDSLYQLHFVSINEFINGCGQPTVSRHGALTVDLAYDPFVKEEVKVMFGDVLRYALLKESKLPAWCKETRTYETVVQRKICTSLPPVLALSCACAGKRNEEGLAIWRNNAPANGHWLPEFIEVELEEDGNVIVRELVETAGEAEKVWKEFEGSSQLPGSISDIVKSNLSTSRKHRYRLDAVLSFVRDDMDAAMIEQLNISASDEAHGHHILHARVSSEYKRQALDRQRIQAEKLATAMEAQEEVPSKLTLTSMTDRQVFEKRVEEVQRMLDEKPLSEDDEGEWVLFNGFVVSPTVVEDARAFHVPFKEPCLVVFRAVDGTELDSKKESKPEDTASTKLPITVMQTTSLSTGRPPEFVVKSSIYLPGKGDLIAFDAEFVSVQEEESVLTNTGSKLTIRETRYALARVSVIDCKSGRVIVDDHVLPHEPVVDYLTRFSGIVENDLDPKNSPHHLVSMRAAYLKLRYLTERGCIFVGHGLTQDFLTVNLVVPPDQIIDTVEIYHQPKQRYISLRFITNYIFGLDIQEDIHDSVEDARAAYELYRKALALKKEGKFDQFLQDLYTSLYLSK